MELISLLISMLSTTFTFLILSLLLPFRYLLRHVSNPRVTADPVILYQGTVWHAALSTTLSATRFAMLSLTSTVRPSTRQPTVHLSADEARRVANTNGPVFLLTIPPSVGYEQNPLRLYDCYNFEASKKTLRKCIAEDMLGNWSMKTNDPGDNLHVVISVHHPKLGNYFTASLTAKRVAPSMSGALKLWWKNVSLIQHPRYQNPAYKEEALLRDETIRCCQACGGNQTSSVREPGRTFDQVSITENIRCCTWTDASWPWC